ncbi:MAG: DUF308 domain-containing protein [Candidatus Eremiobacteraeota bacterium]|nr:DUF308 domain-containing protein [Candidatus Eremiobacteraeota bacterium]
MNSVTADVAQTVHDVRSLWGWYLALGIALIALGAYAIYEQSAATIASVIALGVILMLAGVTQIISGFMARSAGHVILLLLVGVLDIVVGLMLVQHPNAGALTVTLLLAALFVFGGIYRFVAALWLQFPQYGWVAASGIVSTVLGCLLWAQWPNSASWFLGFAVGVNFIFAGISWSAIALKLKSVTA